VLRLGLRAKFFFHSNALILVTMSLVTFLAIRHERRSRYDAIAQRGLSVTEVLSIPITDALLYQELGLIVEEGLIDNYVGEVLERNKDLVRYVVVTDPSGRVTHSNRWDLLGRAYERALGPSAIGKPAASEIRTTPSGESVLEFRMPLNVSTRFWGSLAVGFSLAPIEKQVAAIAWQAVLVAVVLMLGNSLLTAVYVESLIRPVLHLHRTMKTASQGDLTVRAAEGRSDEVRELGGAFNKMMTELQEARKREKAQEAQFARAEKMAAVGTLAAGVAHEVNNPVAGILTCLDMIESSRDDVATCYRYLGLVRDGVKRIERTVLNLLDFSRPRELAAQATSLNERLQRVVELVGYQLRKNRVDVRFDLAPAGAVILADPFQIEQLFLNLVLNAIQAMPHGGSLTLRTMHVAGGRRVAAEVVDTGAGIPEEIRDRIFDPFFTTREVGQGTGLGLSVSYGIASAHGGSIEVESEIGKGSAFRVVLPAGGSEGGIGR
jgi:two-component system, NtrC family, sensor kinase